MRYFNRSSFFFVWIFDILSVRGMCVCIMLMLTSFRSIYALSMLCRHREFRQMIGFWVHDIFKQFAIKLYELELPICAFTHLWA